jgi:hypothetical protein
MDKFWKITNKQGVNTKVAIATASNGSIGLILKPNQFCICKPQMTKMLDAQSKRGFVSIERDYGNDYGYDTGVAFDEGYVPETHAEKKVQEYKESEE